MKWVSESDRFVLHELPARMKPTNVITDIPRKKSVFTPLDLLLKSLAIVKWSRLLVRSQIVACNAIEKEQRKTSGPPTSHT